ncbi:MAG: efflux RND transporter periplasmic adaptor subunit [Hydrogenibacillus sp.]|nr:efflux RND transporter periplasmic adaptor subunit [Hydrogenibacillus sp.]
MNGRRSLVLGIVGLIVLLAAGVFGFRYWSDHQTYVTTDNAQVKGKPIAISAPVTGRLAEWTARTGETYDAGEVIGKVEAVPIVMPKKATIVSVSAVPGTFVAPGVPLAEAFDLDQLWVEAMVKETDLQAIKVGQDVEVTIDAYPDTLLSGRVEEIGLYTADTFSLLPSANTTGNYTKVAKVVPVKIVLDGGQGLRLIPGLSATVRIHR